MHCNREYSETFTLNQRWFLILNMRRLRERKILWINLILN